MGNLFLSSFYKRSSIRTQERLISLRSRIRHLASEIPFVLNPIINKLRHNDHLKTDELRSYQLENLKKIVKFSQLHVPYYRDLFKKIGFHYSDLTRLSVITQLPYLNKEIISQSPSKFIPDYPFRLFSIHGYTSGTTGTPKKICHDIRSIYHERAFIRRLLMWMGLTPEMKKIWLRGDMVVPIEQKDPPFWRFNKYDNQLIMSSYHISQRTIPNYIQAIADFSPMFIMSYPSSLTIIAKYMKAYEYSPIKVKAIVTSSETLFPESRSVIEEMFDCKIFDWYGSYERVAALFSCECGSYHVVEDYSFVEFLRTNNGCAEIVGTNFNNFGMPLIRYRTQDLVELFPNETTCECGRYWRTVKKIIGRTDDYVKLPDGRIIQRLDFVFKDNLSILEAQIYQKKDFSIEIRVVPNKNYSLHDEKQIEANIKERLGPEIPVRVISVKKLPRMKRGKLKAVVSEVQTEQGLSLDSRP